MKKKLLLCSIDHKALTKAAKYFNPKFQPSPGWVENFRLKIGVETLWVEKFDLKPGDEKFGLKLGCEKSGTLFFRNPIPSAILSLKINSYLSNKLTE